MTLQVERDSLNSYADDYEFDVEDEIFDEIESPSDARENNHRYHVEYVNLADFVSIKDEDDPIYSAIVKHPSPEAPELPHHKPKHWVSPSDLQKVYCPLSGNETVPSC